MADAWARCREAGVVASGRAAMWGRSSVRSRFECRLSADAGTATGLRCTFVAPLYGRMAVRMCVAPRACGLGVEGEGSRTESSMHPTEVVITFYRERCALPAEARDTRPADRCQRDQPTTEPRTSRARVAGPARTGRPGTSGRDAKHIARAPPRARTADCSPVRRPAARSRAQAAGSGPLRPKRSRLVTHRCTAARPRGGRGQMDPLHALRACRGASMHQRWRRTCQQT